MVKKELDEMARYRARATRSKRVWNGRRKNDAPVTFFAIGWVLEVFGLLILGVWLLSACGRRFL